jgi:DNA end-binding protein Ku
VQKKVEGHEIALAEEPPREGAQVIDLMEALRASLQKRAPAAGAAPSTEDKARKEPKRATQAAAAPAKRAKRRA